MTRFVILAMPRTGSNLLCTLLDSHPQILCHHELFNPRGVFLALARRDGELDLGTVAERDADPIAFLHRVWRQPVEERCVGFKMTQGQSPEVLRALLEDRETKKIVLRRANELKTYVSTLIAEAIDQWEVYSRSELEEERPRVTVDLEGLAEHRERSEAFYRSILGELERRQQPCLEVLYERLFDAAEQNRLVRFLGVEPRRLEAASVKQNPRDLRDLIVNFEELDARLRGTPLHAQLHDLGD